MQFWVSGVIGGAWLIEIAYSNVFALPKRACLALVDIVSPQLIVSLAFCAGRPRVFSSALAASGEGFQMLAEKCSRTDRLRKMTARFSVQ